MAPPLWLCCAGGCDDGDECTKDKCRPTKPESCSPFPMCAYFPATCTYQKTCDTPVTKSNKFLDGKTRVRTVQGPNDSWRVPCTPTLWHTRVATEAL